jgi:hypothetical protein
MVFLTTDSPDSPDYPDENICINGPANRPDSVSGKSGNQENQW